MKKYVIITDSSCDLTKEYRTEKHIEYAKMMMTWNDEKGVEHDTYASIDWEVLSAKEFYDLIRKGTRFLTALPTKQNYLDVFEPPLKRGEDVLYLACSSGLSASWKIAEAVANELNQQYKNKIFILDTMRAGMAQGSIVMLAQELKEQGKSLEEVMRIINEEKLKYKEVGIPESLLYLKRAGRVTAPAAFFGNIIGLKPILVFDEKGSNIAVEKAIGKKKAFARMAEMIKEDIIDPENQDIYLMHADCNEEDIKAFKEAVLKQVKVRSVIVQLLGPIIGATSGPGTIIINYKGH